MKSNALHKKKKKKQVKKEDDQESTGYGSANCVTHSWICLPSCGSERLVTIWISNCSRGAKNGGLFADLCTSVAQGREPGGEGGEDCASVANSGGFILGKLRSKSGMNCPD